MAPFYPPTFVNILLTLFLLAATIALTVVVTFEVMRRLNARLTNGASVEPHIVVNVAPGVNALEPLPTDPVVIDGAKARLWYSTYKAALDDGSIMNSSAISAANEAVRVCFP